MSRVATFMGQKQEIRMILARFTLLLLAASVAFASGANRNEVWSIDQSDSAGKMYGGTIYIWDAKDLEKVNKQAVAEKVDLGSAAAARCRAASAPALSPSPSRWRAMMNS